jgi:phage baseplate assembly protein W
MGVKTALKNEEYKQVKRNKDLYSDFNHTFLAHPQTGQISRKTNVDAVKLAIRNLVLTNKYERLRRPNFGGNVSRYLFENVEPMLMIELQDHVKWLIETYEPRARVIDVVATLSSDELTIHMNITFSVVTTVDPQSLDLTLYRVR